MNLSEMLRFKDLSERLGGRSRGAIYHDIRAGRLPPPIKFGQNSYWDGAEVEAYIDRIIAEQRAQREAAR